MCEQCWFVIKVCLWQVPSELTFDYNVSDKEKNNDYKQLGKEFGKAGWEKSVNRSIEVDTHLEKKNWVAGCVMAR